MAEEDKKTLWWGVVGFLVASCAVVIPMAFPHLPVVLAKVLLFPGLVGLAFAIGFLIFEHIRLPRRLMAPFIFTAGGLILAIIGVAWLAIRSAEKSHFPPTHLTQAAQNPSLGGIGGRGGGGTITGNNGTIIGGRGGAGGSPTGGVGGDGGGGFVVGDNAMIIGGDGGNAGQYDGRGGRATFGPMARGNGPTALWKYGGGGPGGNASEYNRRLEVLIRIRQEFVAEFPFEIPFINAGIDQVPILWVNKRLEELREPWRVTMGDGGYVMPPLAPDAPTNPPASSPPSQAPQ